MDQQVLVNQILSINDGKTMKEIVTDTKMEDCRRIKDQDAGFEVDDEEGKNTTEQELQSKKEILEEKLKLSVLQHVDSDSFKANNHNGQNDSGIDDKSEQSFLVNTDHVNNNITLNREFISSEKDTNTRPVPTEEDSHIIKEDDRQTATEKGVASNQCSHDNSLKTVFSNDEMEEETIKEIIPVDHQRGLMSEAGRWKIQRHTDYLVNELDAIDLINKLYSQFVFDDDDYDILLDMLEQEGRYKCIMNMLRMLRRKGPNSYIQFLVALERCGYTWIIKTLEPRCGIYKGKMKYSGQTFYELIDNTSPKYKKFVKRCENNIEQVYRDKPGQQFVVVKKVEKGCVEVTFHLISLGSNDDEGLQSCLQDVVQSGFIDSDPVKSDSFTFHRITDEEISTARQSMNEKRVKDLENEIKTLKSEIIDLKVENDALKSESFHSTEIQTFKEHETNKYKEKLQELESEKNLDVWNLEELLDHAKQDKDKLQDDLTRLKAKVKSPRCRDRPHSDCITYLPDVII
ncbi:hypothetical protein SNE40_008563 [Patella caerulea]|uniref:CARD domain-containing protein n=1 Tax=Patella caerulea TaxID=87958 RepID=A0AAN8K683_PATCE